MEPTQKKMKSVLYKEKGVIGYGADVMDVPVPRDGEVLIKVECAVLNPSDLFMMQGDYSGTFEYPLTPGGEGSGTVVASGGGLRGWSLTGKRVAFTRRAEKGGKFSVGGSYAEYCVTSAFQCVVLGDDKSWEQAACSFVNPLTAIGLLDKCREYKAQAVISTGAASQLGRMIVKLFGENGLPLINVVRRQEQKELLEKEYGAKYVLDSSQEGFDEELNKLIKELNATVALDCVSGDMPGRLLQQMPNDAICINYGSLSEQKIGPINPIVFIFKHQRLETFLLPYWLLSKGMWTQWRTLNASQDLIGSVTISKCFGFHQIEEAIDFYKKNMTAGKVFLKPELTE